MSYAILAIICLVLGWRIGYVLGSAPKKESQEDIERSFEEFYRNAFKTDRYPPTEGDVTGWSIAYKAGWKDARCR